MDITSIPAPTIYEVGLQALLREASPDRVGIVKIPSRNVPYGPDSMLDLFLLSVQVPPEKIHEYIPPGNVSHHSTDRDEKVPKIDPSLTIVIVDGQIETGRTLKAALKAVQEQGVSLNKIYFYGALSHVPLGYTGQLPCIALDKAIAFLRYYNS